MKKQTIFNKSRRGQKKKSIFFAMFFSQKSGKNINPIPIKKSSTTIFELVSCQVSIARRGAFGK